MNTLNKIKKIIDEHRAELVKRQIRYKLDYRSTDRQIFLQDGYYIRVHVEENKIDLSLYSDSNSEYIFVVEGNISDVNKIWRQFKNELKAHIIEYDKVFILKDIYRNFFNNL